MLEKEYKVLLEEKQVKKVLEKYNFEAPFIQTNYYYRDIENLNSDVTIRVRSKQEKIFLQIKEPIFKEKGIHIKNEYQKELDEVPDVIDGNLLNNLCGTNRYHDCILIGKLITERKVAKVNGCEIAIDTNHYCGIVDYELEIEFEDVISADILDFLKAERIYREERSMGKFERFFIKQGGMGDQL